MHTFVSEKIINPLCPGLAKEESIAHIAPILSHPYCARIIVGSQKNRENLGHMWHLLLKNVVSPTSAVSMTMHRRKHEIRMYLHYCTTCLLPELPPAPAWGGAWTCLSQRDVVNAGETSSGDDLQHQAAAENKSWPEKRKVMTGEGQEKSKPGDSAAWGTCSLSLFCQLGLQGLQKPGCEGTFLIESDAYNHG